MKKILYILFIIILLLSFVACSNNSEKETVKDGVDKNAEETSSYGGEGDPLLVLDNVNARLALSMACDKEFIVKEILANGSVVLNNGVPSGFFIGPKGTKFEGKDFVKLALEAVIQVKQKFKANHVAKVLAGNATMRKWIYFQPRCY